MSLTEPQKLLQDAGLIPEEPDIPEGDCMVLAVVRTYGSAPTGRKYHAAIVGYRDEIGGQRWTVTGQTIRTPLNVTWADIIVWLTSPSKSKWSIWQATTLEEIGNSKALNHQLYKETGSD